MIPGKSDRTNKRGESTAPPSSPAFPAQAIVGSIGDLSRVLAGGTEVPEEFYFVSGLTILGAICSKDLKINAGIEVEPRLYSVLLGESYEVKKSTGMRKTIAFFESLRSGSKLDILYGVGSAEGLARELKTHPTLLLAFDELRSFVDKCHVQNSALLPMVASLFDSHNWDNAIKDSSISVRDARVSILGCCTTDTYSNMWTNNAIAIGFPNRLLVVCADRKRKVAWPEAPDEGALALVRTRLQQQIAKLPLVFEISPEGKAAWSRWYENLPSTEHSKRLDTIGFRLLGLVALITDQDRIDEGTVQTVCTILDYELSVRRQTDPIDADNTIARLELAIRRVLLGGGTVSKRDLRRRVHADRYGLWAFHAAIRNLANAGDIAVIDDGYRHT